MINSYTIKEIKNLRLEKNLSLEQFSNDIGIVTEVWDSIENEVYSPLYYPELLNKIKEVLKISADDIRIVKIDGIPEQMYYEDAIAKYKDQKFYFPVSTRELDSMEKVANVLKYVPLNGKQREAYEARLDCLREEEYRLGAIRQHINRIIDLHKEGKSITEIKNIIGGEPGWIEKIVKICENSKEVGARLPQ